MAELPRNADKIVAAYRGFINSVKLWPPGKASEAREAGYADSGRILTRGETMVELFYQPRRRDRVCA